MARVEITLKIRPDSPDTNMENLQQEAGKKIAAFGGKIRKQEIKPMAFGLKELYITFICDEQKGATDPLEDDIRTISGVTSVDVSMVTRALG